MTALPDTRQILAGMWLRLRILAPIIGAVICALFAVGVYPTASQKLTAALVVLLVLALDSMARPIPYATRGTP